MIYEARTRPYQHQREALEFLRGRKAAAILLEMGLGKSKVIIDDVGRLSVGGEIDTFLYISTKGSYSNFFRREMARHMPEAIFYDGFLWDGRDTYETREAIRRLLEPGNYLRILAMNIEAISATARARDLAIRFVRSGRCLICVDESTLIKGPDSTRTQACIELGQESAYRRIMTGNPSPASPLDLWSQFEFLQRGALGARNFIHFRARYSIMGEIRKGQRTVKVPIGWQNMQDLADRVAEWSFRRRKEDCLDLPPKIYEMRDVEMTSEQRQIYQSLVDNFWAEIGEGTVTVNMAVTLALRLQQVLHGYVKMDTGEIRSIPTHRPAVLMSTIEESQESAIIWCAYRQDVQIVASHLRGEYGDRSVVEYHGGVAPGDRDLAITKFQDERSSRFFVATPQSGGRGLTLTAGTLVVYYSNARGLEYRLQSEDRSHRVGQNLPVTYVDLVVPGTVDEKIIQGYRAGMDVSAAIMKESPRKWLI